MAKTHFFEVIRPDHNFEFIGRQNYFIGMSILLILLSIVMLPVNHFFRGAALNYSIEFRGGTEMTVDFSGPQGKNEEQATGRIKEALESGGFKDPEVVKLKGADQPNAYILRFGAVSAVSDTAARNLEAAFKSKYGDSLRRFEFSEGGDKIYIRFDKSVEPDEITSLMKSQGVGYTGINRFGRVEDNTFEVVLLSVNQKVKESLDSKLGAGSVKAILASD